MGVELLAPRRARICKQDIYMIRRLRDFLHEPFDVRDLGTIRGDGNGVGTGALVGQGVEGGAGGVAGGGFAGGYVHFGAACLHKAGRIALASDILEERREERRGGGSDSTLKLRGVLDLAIHLLLRLLCPRGRKARGSLLVWSGLWLRRRTCWVNMGIYGGDERNRATGCL